MLRSRLALLAALAAALMLALPAVAGACTTARTHGHAKPGHHSLNAHARWVTSSAWD